MPLSDLLAAWRADPGIAANVAAWRELPARAAQLVPLPGALHPALAAALRAQGIDALYTHQAQAWQAVQRGEHPAVVTGTASGKTLCYTLPVLDRLLRHSQARALYLFPTKSLAQDQQNVLRQMLALVDGELGTAGSIPVATYDGDTPAAARPHVRRTARVLLSNPDMLHAGILPHHTQWADFFQNLCFVVLDEMHVYRGVFGSHVANVLRRLKRVAGFYGAQPRFILTSATIGNPAELAERLIEEPVGPIDEDGAARGPRHVLLYNPPVVDPELGLRRSVLQESVRLARQMLDHDVQSILFGRTRRAVELTLKELQEPPAAASSRQPAEVRGYRSGYLARQRREIEKGLRAARVRAVVATSALELGIDIGGMDAALLAGYPGTIASTWQQAGRAGRGTRPSLAVLIVSADPLEQFLAHHPDYLFGRSPEHALIDADNPLVLLDHLRCAVHELPFGDGEPFGRVPGGQVQEYLQVLEQAGELHRSGDRTFWLSERYPAAEISLRSASPVRVLIHEQSAREGEGGTRGAVVGEVDPASAHWMVHPGAVYLHQGETYLVDELDLEQNLALVHKVELDYYTQPRSETTVELVELWQEAAERGADKRCGEILVTSQVIGYRKLRWFTQEPIGEGEVDLPPTQLLTAGYWLVLAESTVDALRERGLWGSDPNRYGPNWEKQRDRARARDGYRCQVCGILEGSPGAPTAHHVHHKVPFRRFASSEEANRLDNLVTLCPRCHQRVEQAVRVRSGLSGLAYLLSHLAPLYLMCDPGDMGVQSDPRAPLAGNRPAVVFYERVPGGLGFSGRLYDLHTALIARASEWVADCPCAEGCPSCVGPPGEEGVGGKPETSAMLSLLSEPPARL